MKIKYKAPLNDNTGLGKASRDIFYMLNQSDFIEELSSEVINISPNPELHEVDKIKSVKYETNIKEYDINFIFCPPYQFNRFVEENKINIGYTMWETKNIPNYFKDNINLLDGLLLPVSYNVDFFKDSMKNNKLVAEIPLPIIKNDYEYSNEKFKRFTFYSIYEWTERKCPLESLQAYFLNFQNNNDVNFILKVRGNILDVNNKIDILKKIMKLKTYPPVSIITEEYTNEQVKDLHKRSHCYVGVSRGEGWNLPLLDSIMYGNYAISTRTGCVDYLNENLYLVDGSYEPIIGMIYFEHFNAEQNWIIPSVNSIRQKMNIPYSIWKNNSNNKTKEEWRKIVEDISSKLSCDTVNKMLKDSIEKILCQN